MFETVIGTIEHFAKDIEDFTTAKMAFSVLSKMGSSWGGPDIAPEGANGAAAQQQALPGFGQFMITRLSPLCWALPATPSFNSKDAQAKQVLAEAGGLQRTIYAKTGMEYLQYLRDRELPGMGMGADLVEEFVGALGRLDMKGFRQFFPVCDSNHILNALNLLTSSTVLYPAIERMMLWSFYLILTFSFVLPIRSFVSVLDSPTVWFDD